MPFPQRQAAIAGVYRTAQGKLPGRTSFSLQLEAIKGAIADAGMELADIDGLLTLSGGNHLEAQAGADTSSHQFWAEQLGGRPIDYISIGGSAGQVTKAAAAIAAGLCEVAVLFFGRAGQMLGPRGTATANSAPRMPEWAWMTQGAYMVPFYGLWAQRYMHDFGVTSEDLAQIAVIDRYHATLNPESVMGHKGEITVDDVVNSRMISDPLHLLDCSLDNDGGYAVVITTAERARDGRNTPVYVLGGAEAVHTDLYLTQDGDWFREGGRSVRRVADKAFAQAGVTRDDIDYFGSYDCFTITALRNYEEMGFCEIGEGADFVRDGRTRLGGSLPTNTDGGLLSGSHCGDPSGLFVVETVRQLRGECGDRQVANARIGLAHQQGYAVHGLTSAVILGTD